MRIIGGKYKGRRLLSPKGLSIRPTSDSLKETLFNWLYDITGLDALDLFCGTGSIGIEALSRGAKRIVCVDNSEKSVRLAKANIVQLENPEECIVVKDDALRYLKRNDGSAGYDIIFADPPYKFEEYGKLIRAITQPDILRVNGLFVLETSARWTPEEDDCGMDIIKEKRFGDSFLHVFEKRVPT